MVQKRRNLNDSSNREIIRDKISKKNHLGRSKDAKSCKCELKCQKFNRKSERNFGASIIVQDLAL